MLWQNMKRIDNIFSCIFIYILIQVFLNLNASDPRENHPGELEIVSTTNFTGNLWIENPSDENPGEIIHQYISISPGLNFDLGARDIFNWTELHTLLNPLLLDRPPPWISLSAS